MKREIVGFVGGVAPPPDSLEWLDLSVRARNAISSQFGINTCSELQNVDAHRLSNSRNVGMVTIQEMARKLLIRLVIPNWLKALAKDFKYPDVTILTPSEQEVLEQHGWRMLAGGYNSSEHWMLEKALADLDRGHIEYRLCRESERAPILIFRKGGVEVEPEPESEE